MIVLQNSCVILRRKLFGLYRVQIRIQIENCLLPRWKFPYWYFSRCSSTSGNFPIYILSSSCIMQPSSSREQLIKNKSKIVKRVGLGKCNIVELGSRTRIRLWAWWLFIRTLQRGSIYLPLSLNISSSSSACIIRRHAKFKQLIVNPIWQSNCYSLLIQ